ncbi:hypothetical protein AB0M20_41345 [Actinoplanes sp. NPDC051633]
MTATEAVQGAPAHGLSVKGPFVVVVPIAEEGGSAYPRRRQG